MAVGLLVAPVGSASAATTPPPTSASAPRALPAGSIAHGDGDFWTWFGPRSWVAAYGAYGITIWSGKGDVLDYGFSNVLCARATTVLGSANNYFAAQRGTLLRAGARNFTSFQMTPGKVTRLPAVFYGANYFRQVVTYSGIPRAGAQRGVRMRAEVVYDYRVPVRNPTYCFQRSQSRTAPAARWAVAVSQLRSIQSNLAYFGPGL